MTSIEYLRLEPADNGVIISYTECITTFGKKGGTFDNKQYKERKEVFDFDADEKGEAFDEAFDRFKELFKQSMATRGNTPGDAVRAY